MDYLLSLVTELQNLKIERFAIGSELWVDVLHINNPHSFYVRPTLYKKYLSLLEAKYYHPKFSDVNFGDILIFESKTLKRNLRGIAISCKQRGDQVTYKMFAIDVGCFEEHVPFSKIWTRFYMQNVPPLATHCKLADCAPLGTTWGHDVSDVMRSFVEGERAKLIVRSKTIDSIVVELYNSRPDNIATMLALTNYTTFGYCSNSEDQPKDSQLMNPFYIYRESMVGEKLHVRFQSGIILKQFYVITVEDYHLYLVDRDNYTYYARSQKDLYMEDLKINHPVGVLYRKNNKFERALVKKLLPISNKAILQLVDWGITIEESVMYMKPIPDWYLQIPVKALFCAPDNNSKFTENITTLSYTGAQFHITINSVSDDNTMSPNIVSIASSKSV